MKRYIAEAIGTFCLVLAGTGAIVIDDVSGGKVTHVGIALTFGLIVMSMIYAVGHVSGAHINLAVTFGFWLSRRLPGNVVGPYILSQLAGAFAASGLVWFMFTHQTLGATHPAGPAIQTFLLETVLTAMLMFVILSVVAGPKETGLLAGVAIGGVIALEAMFAGQICGASMNPARSLAPAVVSGNIHDVWIYLAAPVIGAAAGVISHKAIS
jgi:aquaporin NIP